MTRFKVTTRPGRRVYRGAPKPLPPGACPHCGKQVAVTDNGCRRAHLDETGLPCTGGGIRIDAEPVTLDEVPPVTVLPELSRDVVRSDRGPTAHGWRVCGVCDRPLPVTTEGLIPKHRSRSDLFIGPYCDGSGS